MRRIVGLAIAFWFALTTIALAQSSVGDVVRLSDGSFFRGTVIEMTPDHVSLLLPTGETRTFARADVASAGPEAPQQAVPMAVVVVPVAPAEPTSHLHIEGDATGLALHTRYQDPHGAAEVRAEHVEFVSTTRHLLVCTLPCERDIRAGAYALAWSRGGTPQPIHGAVTFAPGDQRFGAHLEDRSMFRIAGHLTWIVGAVLGIALVFTGLLVPLESPRGSGLGATNTAVLATGMAVTAVGLGVGLGFAFWNDSFELTLLGP